MADPQAQASARRTEPAEHPRICLLLHTKPISVMLYLQTIGADSIVRYVHLRWVLACSHV